MNNSNEPDRFYSVTDKKVTPWPILRILAGVVVLIVIGLLVYISSLKSTTKPTKKEDIKLTTAKQIVLSRIYLTTSHGQFKPNEQVPVEVRYSTNQSIEGIDIELLYDPNLLEATSGAFFVDNSNFEYPSKEIDSKNGIIKLSAIIATPEKTISGNGLVGTIVFKSKKVGEADLKLSYTPGSTADTNMVAQLSPDDILKEVQDLKVLIK